MKTNLNKKIGATLLTAAVMTGTFVIPISRAADTTTTPSVSYQAHVQDIGWQKPTSKGIAGTTGRSLRMEAIRMHLENCKDVSLSFDAHIQDIGWKNNLKESDLIGTEGQSKRLEAIRIRANGLAQQGYKLQYRVHVQDIGWQNWKNEGEIAGTEGQSKRAEAIEVRIVEDLEAIKQNAIAKVSEVLKNLEQYSADNQNAIKAMVEDAKKAINDAESKDAINKVVADTQTKVDEVKTIEQEAIETAKETAKATLADYDVALGTTLDEQASAEMSEKIAKAIEDIANAETEEKIKQIYDAIVEEIKNVCPGIEDLSQEIATAREDAKKLAMATLEKYEQLAPKVEGLTQYDLGIISTLIGNAKEAINNAKTADEVQAAQDDFDALMTSYPTLIQKVTATDALVDAQKAVKDEIDAYIDALKTDNSLGDNKAIVKDRLDMIKEEVMNAKTANEVNAAKTVLDNFMTQYASLKQTVDAKLLQNAVDQAVKTLTPYLSFKDDKDVDPTTGLGEIGTQANTYIETVKALANDLTKTPDDVTAILVVKDAQGTVTGGAIKTLDDMIEARKAEIKANKDAYEKAKKEAMAELDEYATNAKQLLSGSQLANVEGLIVNTKGNISSTADTTKVNDYMTLFRDTIKTYSSELATYGVEQARKNAVATLKAYEKNENTQIKEIAAAARAEIEEKDNDVYVMTDANEIKQTLKDAEDAIADVINVAQINAAVKEESKKFQAYLTDKYSEEVRTVASTAITTMNSTDFENAKAVVAKSKELMANIEAILKEEGTSSKEELDNAKAPVLEKIKQYREIATKTGNVDSRIISALDNYKAQIEVATTTTSVDEIEEKVDAYINGTVIKTKIDSINKLKSDLTTTLVAPTYANVTIETPAIVEELNTQIENIKKASEKDTEKTVNDAKKAVLELAGKINTLEGKRATALATLKATYGATGEAGKETVADKGLNAMYQAYKEEINAVKLADYVLNTTTNKDNFDAIIARAESAKDSYVEP